MATLQRAETLGTEASMKPDLAAIHGIRSVAEQVYPAQKPGISLPGRISLADLFRRHDFRETEPRSFHAMLRRWDGSNGAVAVKVLWQNTFLMRVVGKVVVPAPPPVFEVEQDVTITEKPETQERALRLGMVLATSDFDLAFLCEVWTPDVELLVLVPLTGKLKSVAVGPAGGTTTFLVNIGAVLPVVARLGSGLCSLGITKGFQEQAFHTFSVQGELPRDADALSQKSVLLCRVDVGPGVLDIYTTHLFNGDDLVGDILDEDRLAIQMSQVDEIVHFIKATHRQENVALLIGDFNIDGTTLDANALTTKLKSVDLFDAWPFQFPRPQGPTPGLVEGIVAPAGITSLDDEAPTLGGGICQEDPATGLCFEDVGPEPPSLRGRIDYVFMEKTKGSHTLNVVIGAVQRQVFHRSSSKFPFLSDHLGLAFNLICSTR